MSFNFPLGQTIYPVCPILDGADFISGYAFKSNDFIDSGHPVIKIKNIQSGKVTIADSQYVSTETVRKLDKFKLSDRDVLIAMTGQGSVGRVGRLSCEDGTIPYLNQRVGKFVADEEKLNIDYLYYVLSTKQYQEILFLAGSGSGQPNLSPATIKSVEIPFAPYEVQCRISSILNAIDEKISLNEKTNQTLEQMAQALFKSWFVEFEPVKAKMAALEAGGSQEDATRAAMTAISGKDADALPFFEREHPEQYAELKATAELFPSAMKDSDLGVIPEGWSVSNIKNNVDVRDGTHASPKASDSGYHLVTSKNITSGYLDRRSCYYISDADYHEVNKRSRVSRGDILISMIGTVGALYFVAENNVDYAIKNIGLIRTSERPELQSIIFYHLKSNNGINYINSRLAGTTQKYLSLKQLREIPIVMPTNDVLAAFNNKTFLHEIHANQGITETLANIRDTLLPKLLSGEITLPEAEQIISEEA